MKKNNSLFTEYFRRLCRENVPPGVGQNEAARQLGISQSAMSKMKAGGMIPSDDMAEKIIEGWGLDAKEFMDVIYKARQDDAKEYLGEDNMKPRLPVKAAAGSLSAYTDGVCKYDCEMLPIIRRFPDYDFTMIIRGNSMEPKYEGGDEIALKRVTILEWGKDYVLDTEDGAIFKKIYEDGDSIRCVSYNTEEYPDFLVPKNMINGYYKFVGLIRV